MPRRAVAASVSAASSARPGASTPHQKLCGDFVKETQAVDADGDRRTRRDRRERALQFVEALFRPFTDELGGDVEIGGRAPVDARGRFEACDQSIEASCDFWWQIERGEEAHIHGVASRPNDVCCPGGKSAKVARPQPLPAGRPSGQFETRWKAGPRPKRAAPQFLFSAA